MEIQSDTIMMLTIIVIISATAASLPNLFVLKVNSKWCFKSIPNLPSNKNNSLLYLLVNIGRLHFLAP